MDLLYDSIKIYANKLAYQTERKQTITRSDAPIIFEFIWCNKHNVTSVFTFAFSPKDR